MITRIPQIINDLYQYYGNDLQITSSGDLFVADLAILSQQRVIRRLSTPNGGFIWDTSYGAGIPGYIGEQLSSDNFDSIKSLILSNILLENTVSPNPEPQIFLNVIQGGLFCQIQYSLNPTLQPIVLNYKLSA